MIFTVLKILTWVYLAARLAALLLAFYVLWRQYRRAKRLNRKPPAVQ